MVEEQEVTMAASIGTMEGVGIAALEVFETAGFNQIGQLKAFNGDDVKLQAAINEIRQNPKNSFKDDAYWKRLFTRCINIIYRARSAEATAYVPAEYMCPITLDWFHDPVVAPSGHSFSREAIEEHLNHSPTNPLTREFLSKEQLYQNLSLAAAVHHCRLHHQRFGILC